MNLSAAEIITRLDAYPATPADRAEVAYRIVMETNRRSKIVENAITFYTSSSNSTEDLCELKNVLTTARTGEGINEDVGLLHLAWGILPSDDCLDGFLAEYYYAWASSSGIPEEKVSKILQEVAVDKSVKFRGHNT